VSNWNEDIKAMLVGIDKQKYSSEVAEFWKTWLNKEAYVTDIEQVRKKTNSQ